MSAAPLPSHAELAVAMRSMAYRIERLEAEVARPAPLLEDACTTEEAMAILGLTSRSGLAKRIRAHPELERAYTRAGPRAPMRWSRRRLAEYLASLA